MLKNENDLLSYLYRLCGLNSAYYDIAGEGGYLMVYIRDNGPSYVDVFSARDKMYEGNLEALQEDKFLRTRQEVEGDVANRVEFLM